MDIQNFITEFKKTFVYDLLSQTLTDEQLFEHAIDGDGVTWFKEQMRQMWDLWQAAKAQAVPEGFVLIKASDRDQEMLELIDQRDHMEGQAEELKDKLQALYGVDFGEHSSCNFPFQNAIDYDDSDLVLVKRVHPDAIVHNQGLGLFKECQVIYGWDGKSKDFKDALNKGFYHGVKLGAKAVLETAMIEAQERK